jgi:hypothetical protein
VKSPVSLLPAPEDLDATMPTSPSRPVFLHSAFRSGSTWFWNRFRAATGTMAFYEPFNEALATLDQASLTANTPEKWMSRHPALGAPYFAEFQPLLAPEGGVACYHARFAYDRYFDDTADEGQRRYIASLVRLAENAGAVPVLGFCRSQGRVGWFRRFCPGLNVVTWRNPWDQWVSFHRLATEDNSAYFEFRAFLIASIARHHPDVGFFFADLCLPPIDGPLGVGGEGGLEPFFYAAHVDFRFQVFLRVYLLDMIRGLSQADVVCDLDAMSADGAVRQDLTDRLRDLTGLSDLSFADCALPRHSVLADGAYGAAVRRALDLLSRHRGRLAATPDAGRAVVAVEERLAETLWRLEREGGGHRLPDAPTGEEDGEGIDRLTLCHVLFAARSLGRTDGDLGLAVGYLAMVYGADFCRLRADLAEMADFIGWCGGGDAVLARRLAEALNAPDPVPSPALLTTAKSGLSR